MRRLAPLAAAALATIALAACSNILGLKDLEPYPSEAGADATADGPPTGESGSDDGPSADDGDATSGPDATGDGTTPDGTTPDGTTGDDAGGDGATGDGATKDAGDASSAGDAAQDASCGGLTSCGGTCVDLQTDDQNCGVCGHDCLTTMPGGCVAGVCQPVLVATAKATDIVVVGTSLYWVDQGGGVWTCDVGSCTQTPVKTGLTQTERIAYDGANTLLWTDYGTGSAADGSVWTYDLTTHTPTAIASGRYTPVGIAADATYVYWAEGYPDQIVQYTRAGGALKAIPAGTASTPAGLAMGNSHVYWTDSYADSTTQMNGTVGSCVEGSCSPSTLASAQGLLTSAVWVDSTDVYWTNLDNAGSVWRAAINNPSPEQVGGVEAQPQRIVGDPATGEVFFTDQGNSSSDGSLVACTGPTSCTTLRASLPMPVGLAVDAKAIYYGTTGGTPEIWKLAR